jgi:RHS repeat-associated protein
MTMYTRQFAACAFFSLSLFVCSQVLGQDPPPEPIDQVKGGTGGDFEHIDLSNGGVNLSIPIFDIKERGVQNFYKVNYSSKNYYTILSPPNGEFWEYQQPWTASGGSPGGGNFSSAIIDYCTWHPGGGNPPQQNPITAYYNRNWTYPDGSTKLYPWLQISLSYQGCDTPPTMAQYLHPYTYDGSSIAYIYLHPDGTEPGVFDSNGNSAGSISPIGTWSNNNTVLTFGFPNGSQIVLKYGSVAVSTAFVNPIGAHNYSGTFTKMLTEIDLPNGTSWQFQYAANSYGQLTKIILPTGGYIRYTYAVQPKFATDYPFGGGVIFKPHLTDSLVVTGRYVSSDGVTEQGETYTYVATNNGTSVSQRIATHLSATGDQQVHIFGFLGTDHSFLETDTQYYQKTTKNVREVLHAWTCDSVPTYVSTTPPSGKGPGQIPGSASIAIGGGNCRRSQETTMIFDGASPLTKTVQYQYDTNLHDTYPNQAFFNVQMANYTTTFNNVTQTLESDWGPGGTPGTTTTPGTAGTAGPLLRETDITYLTTNPQNGNIDYTQSSVHIVNRPILKVIKDGQGNILAQTSYQYDGSALIDTSATPAPGHDYTNYSKTNLTRGNLTQMSRWLSSSGSWLSTNSVYDDLGNLRSQTDPNNNTTQFAYTDNYNDGVNRSSQAYLTQVTRPMTGTVNHITKESYYYATALPYQDTDENGQITTYNYDSMNRPLSVTYPDGGQVSYSYHDSSPFSETTTTKITGSLNRISTSLFDGLGRTKETQLTSDPDGPTYVDKTYDPAGRTGSVSNPYRSTGDSTYGVTSYIYDGIGRPCVVVPSDGTAVPGNSCPSSAPANDIVTSYSGNCITVKDEASKSRTSCSDALGRLTKLTEDPGGLGYITSYSYDALNNLTSVLQNGSRQRTFVYDSLSRLTSATNPESGTVTYTYDGNSNVLTKTSPAPNQTGSATVTASYAYDPLNRVKQKTYSDTTAPAYFQYDANTIWGWTLNNTVGRLIAATSPTMGPDPGGTAQNFSYDSMGRISQNGLCTPLNCGTGSFATNYAYDLAGDLTSFFDGAFVTFGQTFDGAGRLSQLTSSWNDAQHPGTLFTADPSSGYFPSGALRKAALGNGLMLTNVYNNRLQPCRLNVNSSGTPLVNCTDAVPGGNVLDFAYAYNSGTANNGNVASWSSDGNQTFTRSYGYDSLNRLSSLSDTASTQPCKGMSWNYDAWGNLLAQNNTGGSCFTFAASVGTNNRLGSPYTYDAAGNMTYDGTHSYTYDAENRLIKIDGGSTATYIYDAKGKRVRTTVAGVNTDFLRDVSGNVVAEWGSGCSCWTVLYVYASSGLLAEYRSSTTYFVHKDHLGSTRLITDLNKAPVDSLDYLPFGRQIAGSTFTTHKFTGKERDSESGLDNFGARYFGSLMGRFTSPDREISGFANPQSFNLYAYALDNPLRFNDPNGTDPQDTIQGLWQTWSQLREDIGHPLPYVTQNDLSGIVSRSGANSGVAIGEIVGGCAMVICGAGAIISHGNPLGGVAVVGGVVLAGSGIHSLRHSANGVSADFTQSLGIFLFEQQIIKLSSEVNSSSVRDFTPEELSEAKLAANSILQTGFLPSEIAQQVANIIDAINAEFDRRQEEARKKDEEERKKREQQPQPEDPAPTVS